MKIGVIGGTFDPIHYAHLLLAETARETLGLDRVLFVPAGIPPHKRDRGITCGNLRAEMVRAAVSGYPEYEVSAFEIDSDEISYTVRTLRHFHQLWPGSEFVLIVGSDTLRDIPHWYEPAELCRLASPAAAHRAGDTPPDYTPLEEFVSSERLEEFKKLVIPMPLLEISSTEIRNRVSEGRSIRFLTPDRVIEMIAQHGLYKNTK